MIDVEVADYVIDIDPNDPELSTYTLVIRTPSHPTKSHIVVANMDIIFDINESVCPDNINEILEAAWEYISYRIKGTKIPSSENYIKEIKPIKLKRII